MALQQSLRFNSQSFQWGLFGLVVVYLSLLMPNRPGFNYQYELNAIWQYEDLYAPLSFSIRRDSLQMDSLMRLVWAQSVPYYRKDPLIAKQSIDRFNAVMELLIAESSQNNDENSTLAYQKIQRGANRLLEASYKQGILEPIEFTGYETQERIFYLYDAKGEAQIQHRAYFHELEKIRSLILDLFITENEDYKDEFRGVIADAIKPNLIYDRETTAKVIENELNKISPFSGKKEKNELIVRRGARITPEIYQNIESLREVLEFSQSSKYGSRIVFLGNFLLMSLIIGIFYLYLRFLEPELLPRPRKIIFLLMWFILYPTMIYLVTRLESISAYIIPLCIVPIVIKNFLNERLAFITVILLIIICTLIAGTGLDYGLLMMLAGLVAVLFGTETRYWARFFNSILVILITFLLGSFSLNLIRGDEILHIKWENQAALLINVVLTLLAYPAIPLLERVFGFTSSITLAELSDLNKPLLKKMSIKAPGTFQHSIQVSNLAEAAASKIGANALLAKVGSLYHDIGKMKNPMYFVENAETKSYHKDLDPLESCRIIMEHVSEGVNMAKENKLPQVIIDFIKTHHGTTKVEFFLHKYMALYPQDKDAVAKFTYPGPRPKTKEQTIVMMADSIEAASKSVKFKNYEEMDDFVDKIIAQKIQSGQFHHSELNFEELEVCKKVFKKTLRSIYHGRVSYPKEKTA